MLRPINRVIHFTTSYSPFEIVYGLNPLTSLDLLPFLLMNLLRVVIGDKKTKLANDLRIQV